MKSILENLRRLSLLAFAVIAVFISYTLFPAAASATLYVENLSLQVRQEDLDLIFLPQQLCQIQRLHPRPRVYAVAPLRFSFENCDTYIPPYC